MYDIKKGIYKHYKGNLYKVIDIASHSENLEPMVVYQALYGDRGLWVRPAAMWGEEIVINGKPQPRFAYICDCEEGLA